MGNDIVFHKEILMISLLIFLIVIIIIVAEKNESIRERERENIERIALIYILYRP